MKLDYALRLAHQLTRFKTDKFKKPDPSGYYVRQTFFPLATKRQTNAGEDIACPKHTRTTRAIWVRLDKLVAMQDCLGRARLIYQLHRHPLKKRPLVIALPRGRYLIWDGHHRATAAGMLGNARIKVDELRKSRLTDG